MNDAFQAGSALRAEVAGAFADDGDLARADSRFRARPVQTTLADAVARTLHDRGVLLGEWPIIASNVICLSFAVFILTMKLLPRRQKEQVAEALDPTGAPAQRPNR